MPRIARRVGSLSMDDPKDGHEALVFYRGIPATASTSFPTRICPSPLCRRSLQARRGFTISKTEVVRGLRAALEPPQRITAGYAAERIGG